MDLAQRHPLVNGLAHIVDRQQGHRNAGQGLHLHAGLAHAPDGALRLDAVLLRVEGEFHGALGQQQGVAEGDQVAGALGGHDASHLRHAQHIALFGAALGHGRKALRAHGDAAHGHCRAVGDGFFAHIHHPGIARSVHMGKMIVHSV